MFQTRFDHLSAVIFFLLATTQSCVGDTVGTAQVECGLRTDEVIFEYSAGAGFFLERGDAPKNDFSTSRHILNVTTGHEFRAGEMEILRKCWCTQYYELPTQYCPASFNTCLVRGSDGNVSCFELSKTEYLLRGMWPIVLFWYGLLTLAWFCSNRGNQARAHIRRLIQSGCSKQGYETALSADLDEITQNQGYRIAHLRRSVIKRREKLRRMEMYPEIRWLAHWLRGDEYDNMDDILAINTRPAPTTSVTNTVLLSMKVKSFMLPESNNGSNNGNNNGNQVGENDPEVGLTATNRYSRSQAPRTTLPFDKMGGATSDGNDDDSCDDENENTCAICLKPLQQGDLIGDIDCNHLFHKTCLKAWLKRKNSCPLCQRKDIAELCQTRTTTTTTTATTTPTANSAAEPNLNNAEATENRPLSTPDTAPTTDSGFTPDDISV